MNLKRGVIFIIFSLCFSSFLFAVDVIGEIVFIKGNVNITRNGAVLDTNQLEIGYEIENYDLIKTGNNGSLIVELNTDKTPGTTVDISPNTVFSMEVGALTNKKKTSLNMIAGSLALKVKKLSSDKSMDVNSESASMGVRGTTFTVEAAPGGDLLVGCEEGKVECVSVNGKSLYAEPGKAVQYDSENDLQNVPVAVTDLKSFRKNWMADKLSVFKTNPLKAIKQYATKYIDSYNSFNDAYAALVKQNDIINKWYKEDDKGKQGGKMDIMNEKKKLIKPLFTIRKQLVIFEKIYYRLIELFEYYKQGYGSGNIKNGLTVASFFSRFEREQKELEKKMAVVNHVIKMYSTRNGGSFPADGLSGESDAFFDDKNSDF